MNRRDFIKYMSVTPAVAAASNALAKVTWGKTANSFMGDKK